MVDYKEAGAALGAGIHLYQGDKHLKSIAGTDLYGNDFLGGDHDKSLSEIFSKSAWQYAAMAKRRNYIRQIPTAFMRGEDAVTDENLAGISIRELSRIDTTIQVYGWAFYHKLRDLGGGVEFQYMSPANIAPIEETAYRGGFGVYRYSGDNQQMIVSEDDLLIIREDGLRESFPLVSASMASKTESQISIGIAQTMQAFYDTNGLPVIAVIVPPETTPDESKAMKTRFQQLFQRGRSSAGNKTIGLTGDVKIEVISFSPKDLELGTLTQTQIDAILAVNEVPPVLMMAGANRAEAEPKMQEFLQTLATRAELIANTISNDKDFAHVTNGVRIVVNISKHELFQKAELEKAAALALLTGKPIITVDEARERLELEPFGGAAAELPSVSVDTAPTPSQVESGQADIIPTKTAEWKGERSQFKRWLKSRDNPDIHEFKSVHLSTEDKLAIWGGVDDGNLPPFGIATKADIPNESELFQIDARDELEAAHLPKINAALRKQLNALIPVGATDEEIQTAVSRIEETSDELYLSILALLLLANGLGVESGAAQLQMVQLGIDEAAALAMANELADRRASESIAMINKTTRQRLMDSIATFAGTGLTVAALRKMLAPYFGETRARGIAQTEGTAGFQLGTQGVGIISDGVDGMEWYTMKDERVCPICAPRHGVKRTIDVPFYTTGGMVFPPPPAHPYCRCGERLTIIKL